MGIPVVLIGKVADIVYNDYGKSISCVPTPEVMDITIREIQNNPKGFICTNVQETDLAGHSQDSAEYKKVLGQADEKIAKIIPILTPNDIMIIMADHGNDPDIGSSRHTREQVPLMIYHKGLEGVYVGERDSMSDVGATCCDYFNAQAPQNGTSFLDLLKTK